MLYRCVAAIPNGGGNCIEHFYEDTPEGHASAEAFARQYDKPGMGVYDCVSPLRERRRTKASVAQIVGLHVDIDCYKAGLTRAEAAEKIYANVAAPFGIITQINSSGRGIQVYSLLREPIEADAPEAENAQRLLKEFVARLGGDPQPAHFAALMRRVGTTNSKEGGGPCETLQDIGARCELMDVQSYLELVNSRETLFPPPPQAQTAEYTESVDGRLAAMTYEDRNGAGVNVTVRAVIPALIWRACHPADIFEQVFAALKKVAERQNLNWDWKQEEKQTNERVLAAYHNLFEKEHDFNTGEIPVWLPMEFHEAWAAAIANGRRPTMSRNGAGWHIRSYVERAKIGRAHV